MWVWFFSTKKSISNKCLRWRKNHQILIQSKTYFNGILRLEWFSVFSMISMNQVTSKIKIGTQLKIRKILKFTFCQKILQCFRYLEETHYSDLIHLREIYMLTRGVVLSLYCCSTIAFVFEIFYNRWQQKKKYSVKRKMKHVQFAP